MGWRIKRSHFYIIEKQRSHVEEVQLARALLNRIAMDIKSTVQYEGVDVASVTDDLALGELGDLLGGDLSLDLDSFDSSETATTYDYETTFPENMGLYGNQTTIHMDISRIPRQEEYQTLYSGNSLTTLLDIPSDVKMVSYYVREGMSSSMGTGYDVFSNSPEVPGLMRRQLGRAITAYAINNGNTQQLQNADKLLAPEVIAIQFQYFDGYQWLPEWDSEMYTSLPLAVEVQLTIQSSSPYHSGGVLNTFYMDSSLDSSTSAVTYRMVIRIPVGKIRPLDDTDQGMEALGLSIAGFSSPIVSDRVLAVDRY